VDYVFWLWTLSGVLKDEASAPHHTGDVIIVAPARTHDRRYGPTMPKGRWIHTKKATAGYDI
jgi:hypothetical protein